MARHDAPNTKPFNEALAELLREHDYTTQTGNVNWHAFAAELDGLHYETLRKVLTGQRSVTPHVMEECARVLRIKPDHFAEYRILDAQRQFDVREVGFEQALANLQQYAHDAQAARKRR